MPKTVLISLTLVAVSVASESSAALPGEEVLPQTQTNFREFFEFKELPHIEVIKEHGQPVHLAHDALIKELREVSGSTPEVFARDEWYHVPTQRTMIHLLKWFEALVWKYDAAYRHEAWDCDDFALGLTAFCEIAAGRDYDLTHGFAWATMIVQQKEGWSRVPAGGLHELVLVHTEKGFLVIEPQNGFHVPLENYPNRRFIRSVFFN